ncbi:HD domain-containing protein [Tengunoibacter tsumagoiensis]|uniref:HD domain-containing protein n=1 Tax=Tengunoibacter tsumagoiensis TaxID=2014871 RepID=A0A402A077_9CHLR|nr:HD domain-containing protein [Tengunoibacter tsumagoiensis]GCE12452.1 hypothetical protein KTT_23110 [Tengunoibacter tsumagoiensis]
MAITPGNLPLAKRVEEACQAESNIFGYGIWTHHILSVIAYGEQLADLMGADKNSVELAALLHDYASVKDQTLYQDHHLHGPREAELLLREYGYPGSTILAVKECIASHRASIPVEQRTKEAICLASADAMAHIAQMPSLLYLAYVQHKLSIDEGKIWVREKLKRSWNKLCPEARVLIQSRYQAALQVLE